VPSCPSSCRNGFQGNNRCEPQCDIPECGYDPDCSAPVCPSSCRNGFQSNNRCEPQCDIPECGFDPDCSAPVCPSTCSPGFQSNGRCEPECDVAECNYDPDCEPAPYQPPAPTPTRAPVTTRRPVTAAPTRPACPASCRPGFQSNGVCEVQCHIPGCGYDPDCNAPVKQPDNVYLPPDKCAPGTPGCGQGSNNIRGLSLPSRAGRRNSGRVSIEPAQRATRRQKSSSRPVQSKAVTNNWDLYLRNGLIKRRG